MNEQPSSSRQTEIPPTHPQELSPQPSERVYLAEDLFQGEKEIIIRYGESRYRLRITKTGKLILTK